MKKLIVISLAWLFLSAFQSQTDTAPLDEVLNNWHKAAAEANLDAYFSVVTDDFVFLGTDPSERWDKEAFKTFCKPYFETGKGWDFKSTERNWVFSKNGKIAWFDEKLDTWMEECRGSGVMVREGKKWKLAYYNLTVLIENEKIKPFIELRQK